MLPVAFYLPQFHAIPENDAWWGTGFTEWTNVERARPRYPGHRMPRLPTELGRYDLGDIEPTLRQQWQLATQAGIGAFCFHHYWFSGTRLLEGPVDQLLARPDLPVRFLLSWANEPWTRTWDGDREADHVLQPQAYSQQDHVRHARHLCSAFADPRYVRVDDRPVFLIYRLDHVPDPARAIELWRRTVADELGTDLFLAAVESSSADLGIYGELGLDAVVEFMPQRFALGRPAGYSVPGRILRRLTGGRLRQHRDHYYDYATLVDNAIDRTRPVPEGLVLYRCVVPAWDNSPRRASGARILTGSTPGLFQRWVREVATEELARGAELFFVNAWNEWAETAHLEPDNVHGRAYLDAFSDGLAQAAQRTAVRGPE